MTDTPPEWAMEMAWDIDLNGDTTRVRKDIARALEAADKAATERERERCAKVVEAKRGSVPDWPEAAMNAINTYASVDVSRATSSVIIRELAEAIRKGASHD